MIFLNSTRIQAYDPESESALEVSAELNQLLRSSIENLSTNREVLTSMDLYSFLLKHKWEEAGKLHNLKELVSSNGAFGLGLSALWKKFRKGLVSSIKAIDDPALKSEVASYFKEFACRVSLIESSSLSCLSPARESPFQLTDIPDKATEPSSTTFPNSNRTDLNVQIASWCEDSAQLSKELQSHLVWCIKQSLLGSSTRDLIAGLICNMPSTLDYYLQQAGVYRQHLPHLQEGIRRTLFGVAKNQTQSYAPKTASVSPLSLETSSREDTSLKIVEAICRDLSAIPESLQDVTGREPVFEEIAIAFDRQGMKNLMLLGPAGVGKTAIAVALQWRILNHRFAEGSTLASKRILSLDVGALNSNTSLRGQFEKRLQAVINYVEENPNVILFVDEVHLLLGAGLASGSNVNGANLLKPALARGRLNCIAATTDKEYKLYVASDEAFARRFQPVHLDEPNREESIEILKGRLPKLVDHYKTRVGQEFHVDEGALAAAVDLSTSYLAADQRQPAKAVRLLDTVLSLSAHLQEALESRTKVLFNCFLTTEGRRLQYVHSKQNSGSDIRKALAHHQKALGIQGRALDDLRSYFSSSEKASKVIGQIYIRSFALITLLLTGISRRERKAALEKLITDLLNKKSVNDFLSDFLRELNERKKVRKSTLEKILNDLKPGDDERKAIEGLEAYKSFTDASALKNAIDKIGMSNEREEDLNFLVNNLKLWKMNHLSYPYVSRKGEFSIKFRVPSRLLAKARKQFDCAELTQLYEIQLKAESEIASLLVSLDPFLTTYEQIAECAKSREGYPQLHAVRNHIDSLFENSYAVSDEWASQMPSAKTVALLSHLESKLKSKTASKVIATKASDGVAKLVSILIRDLKLNLVDADTFERNPNRKTLGMLDHAARDNEHWKNNLKRINYHFSLMDQLFLARNNPSKLSHCLSVLLNLLADHAGESANQAIGYLSKLYARATILLQRIALKVNEGDLLDRCFDLLELINQAVRGGDLPTVSFNDLNDTLLIYDQENWLLATNISIELKAFQKVSSRLTKWLKEKKDDPYVKQLLLVYNQIECSISTELIRAEIDLKNAKSYVAQLSEIPFTRVEQETDSPVNTSNERRELANTLSHTFQSLAKVHLFEQEASLILDASKEVVSATTQSESESSLSSKISKRVAKIWRRTKELLGEELTRFRLVLPALIKKIAGTAKTILSDHELREVLFSDIKAIVRGVKGLFSVEILNANVTFAGFNALKELFASLGQLTVGSDHRSLAKRYLTLIVSALRNQIAGEESELRFILGGVPAILGREMHDVATDLTRVALQSLAIDSHRVALEVHRETNVSVDLLLAKPGEAIRYMEEEFTRRVLGQPVAIQTIIQGIKNAANGVKDPRKPQGIYLLIGGTGNGKSLTGATLKDFLPSSKLITYNMSEYSSPESVTSLIGSPKGYVNHQEGGKLVEDALLYPNAIFVFEEIDQAHPNVLRLFYQIMETGELEDSGGVKASFAKTTIVMTTNYRFKELEQIIPRLQLGIRPLSKDTENAIKTFFFEPRKIDPVKILKKLFIDHKHFKTSVDYYAIESLIRWVEVGVKAFPKKHALMKSLGVDFKELNSEIIQLWNIQRFEVLPHPVKLDLIKSLGDEKEMLTLQSDDLADTLSFLLLGIKDKLRSCSISLEQSLMWDEKDESDTLQYLAWSGWMSQTSLFNHFPKIPFLRTELFHRMPPRRDYLGRSDRHSAIEIAKSFKLLRILDELTAKTASETSTSCTSAGSIEEHSSDLQSYLTSLEEAKLSVQDRRSVRDLLSDNYGPFTPAWVNRVTAVVPYFPLTSNLMSSIIELEWTKFCRYPGMEEFELIPHPSAIAHIRDLVKPEVSDGARPVKRALESELGGLISRHLEEGTLPSTSRVFKKSDGYLELIDENLIKLTSKRLNELMPDISVEIHPSVVDCHNEILTEEELARKIFDQLIALVNGQESRLSSLIEYDIESQTWTLSVFTESDTEPLFFYSRKHLETVEWELRVTDNEDHFNLQLLRHLGQEVLMQNSEQFTEAVKKKLKVI